MATKNTTKKENVIKVDNAALTATAKGVGKEIAGMIRDLKNERKTLKSTLRNLIESESDAGAEVRDFFGLTKKVNKHAINKAIAYISKRYRYAIKLYYKEDDIEEVNIEFAQLLPATKGGREKTDYLDVIKDILQVECVNRPKRMELGAQIRKLWNSEGARKLETPADKIRYALALKNTFAKKLAMYQVTTQIVGEIVRKKEN